MICQRSTTIEVQRCFESHAQEAVGLAEFLLVATVVALFGALVFVIGIEYWLFHRR